MAQESGELPCMFATRCTVDSRTSEGEKFVRDTEMGAVDFKTALRLNFGRAEAILAVRNACMHE